MNTIEELEYYCEEPQPVGALMLTGEWGCRWCVPPDDEE